MFSHMEYCDVNFVYEFCKVNAGVAVEEYQRPFPNRKIPSSCVFTRINHTSRDNVCLTSVAVRSEKEVVRVINTRQNILEMVLISPRLSIRRMVSRNGLYLMPFWRILHEKNFYNYYGQMIKFLEPGDHAQRMNFVPLNNSTSRNVKCISFMYEKTFILNGVKNSRNVLMLSH